MQVLQAVVARVQDFEEKVRSKAIGAICEAAIAHPEVSHSCITVAPCISHVRLATNTSAPQVADLCS